MMPTMILGQSTTTEMAINDFEKRHNLRLPALYKRMLRLTNGGRPEKPKFPITGLTSNPYGSVNFFFGIDPTYQVYDLERVYDLIVGRVPGCLLPIADNGGVDYICLDIRSNNEKVVFWDRSHFWSTGEWRDEDLYLISDSFEIFLNELVPL